MAWGPIADVTQAKSHGQQGGEEDSLVDVEMCDDLGENGNKPQNLEKQGEGNDRLVERKK
jgi:hypothetical protein